MAVNKISMGINYRKKTNSRMTGNGNYFAEVASPPTPLQRARGVVTQEAETATVATMPLTRTE